MPKRPGCSKHARMFIVPFKPESLLSLVRIGPNGQLLQLGLVIFSKTGNCGSAVNKLGLELKRSILGKHMPYQRLRTTLIVAVWGAFCAGAEAADTCSGGAAWTGDLAPIAAGDWNVARAAHLMERAGFGATPEMSAELAKLDPARIIHDLAAPQGIDNSALAAFDESGIFDAGLDPFPASRPALTDQAKEKGEALGVKIKPSGNRRLQPVVDRFFYWLRASKLETQRLGYWWANRMLNTKRPLEEKMALFWHGHFVSSEEKVRDYRKMLKQLQLFQTKGLGDFRDLLIGVAQDPAMLAYLDAAVNLKGAPNENFAREIMELFTMGVGNYTEPDVREGVRAFTGWNFAGTTFVVNDESHDGGEKTFLGEHGPFDGVQVIDIILKQPVTADYLAGKLYRFFVRDEVPPKLRKELGDVLRANKYQIAPLLETIFRSRDFYSSASCGTHIKSPVELVVSTYKKLGLGVVPGVPDFHETISALGQTLFWPPTVAGWAQGRSWITPGLLIERGNFARDIVFPDIGFIPPDRNPGEDFQILQVSEKLARGLDISSATVPDNKDQMATANMMADRDEDFNTRYGSYRGWQKALEKVKPLPRHTAPIDLTKMLMTSKTPPKTPADVVDYFVARMFVVPPSPGERERLAAFLEKELGTKDIGHAQSYMEEGLRMLLHLILSSPEYQLG